MGRAGNMEELLKKADELGRMIQDTDTYREYRRSYDLLRADPDAEKLLDDFITLSNHIRDRQEMGDIIEKFEIDSIRSMSDMISGNDLITRYLGAQQEYLNLILMIQKELEGAAPEE